MKTLTRYMKFMVYVLLLGTAYRVLTGGKPAELLVLTTASFVAGVIVQERRWRIRLDQLHWLEQGSGGVGDMTLEREVRRLRRRIAGLLASPRLYVRARRLVAPLDVDAGELNELLVDLDESHKPIDTGDLTR